MDLPLEVSIQETSELVNVASTAMQLPPEMSIQETAEPVASSKSANILSSIPTHILLGS